MCAPAVRYAAPGVMRMDHADFDQFLFVHDRKAKPVLYRGTGPGVIICHELSGTSPTCLRLARRIADAGFTSFVPVLFGKPGQSSMARGALRVCLSREFTLLATGKRSPISAWIAALAKDVARRTKHSRVVAVGMCVTGGIVLPVLLSDDVSAVVASQPSLPFAPAFIPLARRGDLGMSDDDLNEVRDTAKPVLGLRFQSDWMCPRQRLDRLEAELPAAEVHTVPSDNRNDHSVLTLGYEQNLPGTADAYSHVIAFLRTHLSGEPG